MLAATLGDHERAERHFAAAHELNRRLGARTWLARGCYEHGRMLAAVGEHAYADPLLGEASALAEEIGLPSLLARIRALRFAGRPIRRANGELSPREADVLRLVARGALESRNRGGALDQRAYGREPRALHPSQDGHGEPDGRCLVGARNGSSRARPPELESGRASVRHRAAIRRANWS